MATMASCGFAAVTVNHCWQCCQNRSEIWSNAKIQKLQIFSVVFTSFDSFISECSIWSREFRSIFRSSLQSWDLRFFRGDLRVFDFFGNTHRETLNSSAIDRTIRQIFLLREVGQGVARPIGSQSGYFLQVKSLNVHFSLRYLHQTSVVFGFYFTRKGA